MAHSPFFFVLKGLVPALAAKLPCSDQPQAFKMVNNIVRLFRRKEPSVSMLFLNEPISGALQGISVKGVRAGIFSEKN